MVNDNKTEYLKNCKEFSNQFSPERLKQLEGTDVLNTIFPHDTDKHTLAYNIEFQKKHKEAGGIVGTAYMFSLFKKHGIEKWIYGSPANHKIVDENEATEIATEIRDVFVEAANYIKNCELNCVNDYDILEEKLIEIFKDISLSPQNNWIHKYFVLLFPDKFPRVHNEQMKEQILKKFHIEPEDGYYAKDGQLYLLSQKAGIHLYSLFDENLVKQFYDYKEGVWEEFLEERLINITDKNIDVIENIEKDYPRNLIYFGAPGTGKSYNLNKTREYLVVNNKSAFERVTFHPDYSYANFVGTYKPVMVKNDDGNDDISYDYVPGPFTRVLVRALNNPSEEYLLIIEEINRANVAGVFGDIFQLLDRTETGESEYSIETSEDMRKYLKKHIHNEDIDIERIKIPSNMYIWATMNSADQGVFPMDSAFKRRWDFEYLGINDNKNPSHKRYTLGKNNSTEITWDKLRRAINDELLNYNVNEDKLLGYYFIPEDLENKEFIKVFSNKVLMYLFEDVAKAKRNKLFNTDTKEGNILYSEIRENFIRKGIEVFCDNIQKSNYLKE